MFLTFHFNRKLTLIFLVVGVITLIVCCGAVNPASATSAKKGVKLPIIMYHSMLKDKKYQGKYVISPDTFEKDIQYLQKNGYTAIVMNDLINYVNQKAPLPEKPVMITFDDGYYNNYLYAYPLAQKYHVKIIISPIGYNTDLFSHSADADNANYAHCTWDEINEMMESGYVEFQNHTYNLHASKGGRLGAGRQKGESMNRYTALLNADLTKMQQKMKEHTGYTPTTFVYPFGHVSKESIPIVRDLGFQASMTCEYKMNYITQNPECLYGLGRYLRPAGKASESYFSKIGVN